MSHRPSPLSFLALVATASLWGPAAVAQEDAPEPPAAVEAERETPSPADRDRPVVGLVLSGGGARGFAHVGVLRELERMRVPVDLVAGTSMGAIVGGFYASGMTPAEIEALTETLDWPALLSERPPRGALENRERALQRRYSFPLRIGLAGGGLRLPGGLIAGQELELLLRRHTLAVAGIEDFSSLPVPYLAVATDLERAEPVVFRSGDLVVAMRASMAIPVFFTPVVIDGRILADGGIVDNLPVDLAREAGADVTIAVDVAPTLKEGEGLRTLPNAAVQLARIIARQNMRPQLERADVVIAPDLEGWDMLDFTGAEEIVERGAAAVREIAGRLEPYAINEAAYAAWRANRRPPALPATIDGVEVDYAGRVDPRRLRARIDLAPGDPLEVERLEAAVRALHGVGAFERVGYDLERRDGETIAVLRPEEDSTGPSVLRFGFDLVTDSGGADLRTGLVTFNARVAWVREDLNARGGATRVEAAVGQSTGLLAELHQPLDFAGRWFVAPAVSIESERQPLFDEAGRLVREYAVDRRAARVGLGRTFGHSARGVLGLARSWIGAGIEPSFPGAPEEDEDVAALEAGFTVDRLDDLDLPGRGAFLDANLVSASEGLGSDRDWDRLTLEAKAFATAGATTGFAAVSLQSALGTRPPVSEDLRLGGFLSLSGFGPGEIRGPYGGVARLGAYHRVASLPPAMSGVFLGAWGEAGNAWPDSEAVDLGDLEWAGTIAAGAETILGTLYVAYGRAGEGSGRIYVALGPAF